MRGVYICVCVSDWKGYICAEREVGGGVCVCSSEWKGYMCAEREREVGEGCLC